MNIFLFFELRSNLKQIAGDLCKSPSISNVGTNDEKLGILVANVPVYNSRPNMAAAPVRIKNRTGASQPILFL